MTSREVALLASLAYHHKWARTSSVQPDKIIETARVFEDYLKNRHAPVQDTPIQDTP